MRYFLDKQLAWGLVALCLVGTVEAQSVSGVSVRQRYPWNNLVDIDYTIQGVENPDGLSVQILIENQKSGEVRDVSSWMAKAPPVSNGPHRVTWDPELDGFSFLSTNALSAVYRVVLCRGRQRYMVVDLSNGSGAGDNGVRYLPDIPEGGWTEEYKRTKLVLRRIPAGRFSMGSLSNEFGRNSDEDRHPVTLTKDFYIGVFEVTQSQWELVTGTSPSCHKGDIRPVESVTFEMIRGAAEGGKWPLEGKTDPGSFLGELRARSRIDSLDLPTEAQWEYACRAGTLTSYNGLDPSEVPGRWSGCREDGVGTFTEHTVVGLYPANRWGLYDMHGNVQEWCLDWYAPYGAVKVDPVGPGAGTERVCRGGCWEAFAKIARSACRSRDVPGLDGHGSTSVKPNNTGYGFRLCRTISATGGGVEEDGVGEVLSESRSAPVQMRVEGEKLVLDPMAKIEIAYSDRWNHSIGRTIAVSNGVEELFTGTGEGTFPWTAPDICGQVMLSHSDGENTIIRNITLHEPLAVTNVVAYQRYPWSNLVDLRYTVAGVTNGECYAVRVEAKDGTSGKTWEVKTVDPAFSAARGTHRVTWDPEKDLDPFSSTNVCFSFSLVDVSEAGGSESAEDATGGTEVATSTSSPIMVDIGEPPRKVMLLDPRKIAYSSFWGQDEITPVVRINGEERTFDTAEGVFDWIPRKPGSYLFVHEAGAASFSTEVVVEPAVVKDAVAHQRYPWWTEVDIEYTLEGILQPGKYRILLEARDPDSGKTYPIDNFEPKEPQSTGKHRVTWRPLKDNCTNYVERMTIHLALCENDSPEGGGNVLSETDSNSFDLIPGLTKQTVEYDPHEIYYKGEDPREPVEIQVNGKEIFRGTGEGVHIWTPEKDGDYTISLISGETTNKATIHVETPIQLLDVDVRQRYPWNNLVDIKYRVKGMRGKEDTGTYYLDIDVIDRATDKTNSVLALDSPATFSEGLHQIVWSPLGDDVVIRSFDVTFLFTVCVGDPARYLVIDLSPGPNSARYPVTTFATPPAGGWSEDYKKERLLLRKIPAGTFRMGSPEGEIGRADDEVLHDVALATDFYMGVFEVTQRQWECVMGADRQCSLYKEDRRPVEGIDYNDVRGYRKGAEWPGSSEVDGESFMGRLRKKTGLAFLDLPTEAQWEYACRAGTQAALNNGLELELDPTGHISTNLSCLGRYEKNHSDIMGQYSDAHTVVGSYLENRWGLYDMHGNVMEWCLDWYGDFDGGAVTNPVGPLNGHHRVLRGGSWAHPAIYCRSANRGHYPRPEGYPCYGFRVAGTQANRIAFTNDEVILTYEAAAVPLDIQEGTRMLLRSESRDITYSEAWGASSTGGPVTVSFKMTGDASSRDIVKDGEGAIRWSSDRPGEYLLSHHQTTNDLLTADMVVLPDLVQGVMVSYQMKESCGEKPYYWELDETNPAYCLPKGMSLSEEGLLSGIPGETGDFLLHAVVISGDDYIFDKFYPLRVLPPKTVSLKVLSSHGDPDPGNGENELAQQNLSCHVERACLDSLRPTIQYLCTGWTGTGSVPASGTGTNVSFALLEDSSITWNWQTNYWIDLSAEVVGTTRPAPFWAFSTDSCWVRKGDDSFVVSVRSSGPHCNFKGWRGDIDGCVCQGSRIHVLADRPRKIWAEFEPETNDLQVESAYGDPVPAQGLRCFVRGEKIHASVDPVVRMGATNYLCTGWTGTGSVPASGTATNLVFSLEEDSSLVWNWQTNYWMDVKTSGNGSVSIPSKWCLPGELVTNVATPAEHFSFSCWSVDGKNIATKTIVTTIDRALRMTACFEPVVHLLSIDSEHGDPSPARGGRPQAETTAFTAEVSRSVFFGTTTNYLCTGWTGTGSVPAAGTTNVVTFPLLAESSIRWNWQTNYWLALTIEGPGRTDCPSRWMSRGSTNVISLLRDDACGGFVLEGDVDDLLVEDDEILVRGDRARSLTIRFLDLTLETALDEPSLTWGASGATPWIPQREVSHDGFDAAVSGLVVDGDLSAKSDLETTVPGPCTLGYWMKVGPSDAKTSGVDVYLDELHQPSFSAYGETDWVRMEIQIPRQGEHRLRWSVWTDGSAPSPRVWIDEVRREVLDHTVTTDIPVPYSWLDQYGLAPDGDYEKAANDGAENGLFVWECYLAGLDPTDGASRFIAWIEMAAGQPVITWRPDLGTNRVYEVEGKEKLADPVWMPRQENHRFFRVKVGMPE